MVVSWRIFGGGNGGGGGGSRWFMVEGLENVEFGDWGLVYGIWILKMENLQNIAKNVEALIGIYITYSWIY